MTTTTTTFFKFIFIILGFLFFIFLFFGFFIGLGMGGMHNNPHNVTIFVISNILTIILCFWFTAHQIRKKKETTKTMELQMKTKTVIQIALIIYRILMFAIGCAVFTHHFLCVVVSVFGIEIFNLLLKSEFAYTTFALSISAWCIIYQTKSIVKIIRKKKE